MSNNFTKSFYEEIISVPLQFFLTDNASKCVEELSNILKEAKENYAEYDEFYFCPEGIDYSEALVISKRGGIPNSIIEAVYNNTDCEELSVRLFGVKTEVIEEIQKRKQVKEEHEALESRERALLARLKKKYEDSE